MVLNKQKRKSTNIISKRLVELKTSSLGINAAHVVCANVTKNITDKYPTSSNFVRPTRLEYVGRDQLNQSNSSNIVHHHVRTNPNE